MRTHDSRSQNLVLAAVLSLCLGACASSAKLPAGTPIGETLVAQPVLHFAVVDADPPAYFERTLLVEATVLAVCLKMGCWMQVGEGERTAMVRWEAGCGGQFAFPADAVGKRVLIQGSFYPKSISEDDAEHLQEEAGADITIAREGYEFNASAVLVLTE